MKNISGNPQYIGQDRAKLLLEKWGKVLDYTSKEVKPIESQTTRLNTAMVLESQERWCLENVSGGTGGVFTTQVHRVAECQPTVTSMQPVTLAFQRC
jgi:hypothetical protein